MVAGAPRRSNVNRVAREFQQRLDSREYLASVEMAQWYNSYARTMQSQLENLFNSIEHRDWDPNNPSLEMASIVFQEARFKQLMEDIRLQGLALGEAVEPAMTDLMKFGATEGRESAGWLLEAAYGDVGIEMLEFTRIPTDAIFQFVGVARNTNEIFEGRPSPVKDSIERFAGDHFSALKVMAGIGKGLAAGDNPLVVARRLSQDIAGSNFSKARTIARTEMLRAYRASNVMHFKENGIEQYRWISALDGSTCFVCMLLHGKLFNIDDPFDTHPNCRCSPAPVPFGSRVDVTQGDDWFNNMPMDDRANLVEEHMGKFAGEAYRRGWFQVDRSLIQEKWSDDWGTQRGVKSLTQLHQENGFPLHELDPRFAHLVPPFKRFYADDVRRMQVYLQNWGMSVPEWIRNDIDIRDAMASYQTLGFSGINRYLRGTLPDDMPPEELAAIRKYIEHIDRAFSGANPIDEGLIVHRMANLPELFDEDGNLREDLIDSFYGSEGYLSTTLSDYIATQFSDRGDRVVLLEIRLPEGFEGALPMQAFGSSIQMEVLLDRGMGWRIVETGESIVEGIGGREHSFIKVVLEPWVEPFRTFDDRSKMINFLNRYNAYISTLPEAELEAFTNSFRIYDMQYRNVNEYLRAEPTGEFPPHMRLPDTQQRYANYVAAMDEVFDNHAWSVPEGIVVYRGTSAPQLFDEFGDLRDDLIGEFYGNEGFASTSLDVDFATRFYSLSSREGENAVLLKIQLPKGYEVLPTDNINMNDELAYELLLRRGAGFRIVGMETHVDTRFSDEVISVVVLEPWTEPQDPRFELFGWQVKPTDETFPDSFLRWIAMDPPEAAAYANSIVLGGLSSVDQEHIARLHANMKEGYEQFVDTFVIPDVARGIGSVSPSISNTNPADMGGNPGGSYNSTLREIQIYRDDRGAEGNDHAHETMIHELGHWMDHDVFGPAGHIQPLRDKFGADILARVQLDRDRYPNDEVRAWEKLAKHEMENVMKAIAESNSGKEIIMLGSPGAVNPYFTYLADDRELWARAFAQYVVTKVGDDRMMRHFHKKRVSGILQTQWDEDDFEPIFEAMDDMFRRMGLLKHELPTADDVQYFQQLVN